MYTDEMDWIYLIRIYTRPVPFGKVLLMTASKSFTPTILDCQFESDFKIDFRALYAHHESSIFLLDDPLSAVDPKVSNEIFSKYIIGFLRKRSKTVLFATHGMQVPKFCTWLIELNGPPRLLICHQRAVHKRKIS